MPRKPRPSRSKAKEPDNELIREQNISEQNAKIAAEYGLDLEHLEAVPEAPPGEQPLAAAAPAAKPRRARSAADPIQIDPTFVSNPARMQYALLLALLLRSRGTARFTAKDMMHVDTDYNVVFARSLDGQFLEVTVVSAESGIIRSPEAEMELWKRKALQDAETAAYSQLPAAPAVEHYPSVAPNPNPATMGMMGTNEPTAQQQQPVQPIFQTSPDQRTLPTGTLTRETQSRVYQNPFEVGDSPQNARVDLSAYAAKLASQDQSIAAGQDAAIARVERGEPSGSSQ